MKLAAAAAVAMAAVAALAAPYPTSSASCQLRRSTCSKMKRAVDAFSGAVLSSPLKARDEPGLPESDAAATARRGLGELAALMAVTSASPNDFVKGLGLDVEAKLAAAAAGKQKREASPRPWCSRRAWVCWKRDAPRTAAPAIKKREPSPRPWCSRLAWICWKRSVSSAEAPAHEKREAESAAHCSQPGTLCARAKQAADAVLEAVAADADTNEAACTAADLCQASESDLAAVEAVARRLAAAFA